MPNTTRQSRFNPAYLAARHAGLLFACVALGLCAGIAWRTLVQPTRYRAEADVFFNLSPESAAPTFDWESKTRSWKSMLANQADQDVLGSNLRYLVKLAATAHGEPDVSRFPAELARFEPARTYSAVLYSGWLAAAGPTIAVTRRDLAANLDFQTLATVIADLDPPRGVNEWDVSFFHDEYSPSLAESIIVNPDQQDRYFRVFYHLYSTLQPSRNMITAEEAWRTAVDEVADRLDREAQFPGGGGFGYAAKRELVREIAALPMLAANSLYHAFSWSHGDTDFRDQSMLWSWRWRNSVAVSATMRDAVSGTVAAGMVMDLHPLTFPRDDRATRIPPLVVSTVLAYIAKQEQAPAQTAAAQSAPPQPTREPPPTAEPEDTAEVTIVNVQPMQPLMETPNLAAGTVVDEETERLRRETELLAQARIRQVRLEREAALRYLDILRDREKTLVTDIWAARERADRLVERHEALAESIPPPDFPASVEEARLEAERDIVRAQLAELLLTCTEEHPYVRQARREIVALELMLDELAPGPAAKREREERETRVRNARMEWEAARLAVDNLDERRRRNAGDVQNAMRAVESIDAHLIELDRDLAKLHALPVITVAEQPPPAQPQPAVPSRPRPEPQPAQATPVAAPARQNRDGQAIVQFATIPQRVPPSITAPSWEAPILGLLAGLALGVLAGILRELTTRTFRTVGQAQRLVHLRPLAALPAYDGKTLRAAAAGMKGEVFGKKNGALLFIPALVESAEPKPAARRGKIAPVKQAMPLAGWIIGLAVLALAATIHFAGTRVARPEYSLPDDIAMPPASSFDIPGTAQSEAWGEMP